MMSQNLDREWVYVLLEIIFRDIPIIINPQNVQHLEKHMDD